MVESTPLTLIEVEEAQPRIIRGYISVEKECEGEEEVNRLFDMEVEYLR